jgi:hypothetical protein
MRVRLIKKGGVYCGGQKDKGKGASSRVERRGGYFYGGPVKVWRPGAACLFA